MSNDIELLPCPFCGGTDISDGEVLTAYPNGKQTTQSMCNGCKSLGAEAVLDDGEIDYGAVKAIIAWNTRAALATPQQDGLMVDISPPATTRDRWMYEQERLAERDPRSHPAPPAAPKKHIADMVTAMKIFESTYHPESTADYFAGGYSAGQDSPAAPVMSDEDRSDALQDLQFVAGFEAGWNAGVDGNETLLCKVRERSKPARALLSKGRP